MAGELAPNKGEVLINNKDLSTFDFRDYILYVDQKPTLVDKSIEENIRFYRESDINIKAMIEKVNLKKDQDKIVSSDEGLSGGERMRIAILRPLVDIKLIMIYDEPTSAIDQVNSDIILRDLLFLDATVIIIAHKLDTKTQGEFDEIIEL